MPIVGLWKDMERDLVVTTLHLLVGALCDNSNHFTSLHILKGSRAWREICNWTSYMEWYYTLVASGTHGVGVLEWSLTI
jgi:hypothetical protein